MYLSRAGNGNKQVPAHSLAAAAPASVEPALLRDLGANPLRLGPRRRQTDPGAGRTRQQPRWPPEQLSSPSPRLRPSRGHEGPHLPDGRILGALLHDEPGQLDHEPALQPLATRGRSTTAASGRSHQCPPEAALFPARRDLIGRGRSQLAVPATQRGSASKDCRTIKAVVLRRRRWCSRWRRAYLPSRPTQSLQGRDGRGHVDGGGEVKSG